MNPLKRLTDFLEHKKIPYEVMHHEVAYSAMEIAEAQHVPGKQFVKSVVVKHPDGYILCVLPAIHNLDFNKLQEATGIVDLSLAPEDEVGNLFRDWELGAEPPFGHWQGLPVYADELLTEDDYIVFNAGTHTQTIKIKMDDWRRLANPQIVNIGVALPA